jgi:ribosomal 50S subunit-recycling heat shock protein
MRSFLTFLTRDENKNKRKKPSREITNGQVITTATKQQRCTVQEIALEEFRVQGMLHVMLYNHHVTMDIHHIDHRPHSSYLPPSFL